MTPIRVTHSDGVCEILMDRPAKMNALTDSDFVAFTEIARDVASSDARAVLIHGAGGYFCAGKDIGSTNPKEVDGVTLILNKVNPLFQAIRAIPVPTIAAVDGVCLGGGFGIAFACDIVIAADSARLGSPFRNIGLIADSGTHYYLRELLGYHRAAELIYTSRLLTGAEAAAIGLINRTLPAAEVLPAARALAADIATGPTAAYKVSKRILQDSASLDDVLDAEAVGQGPILKTQDATEGLRAFQQKRKPKFIGA